MSMQGVEYPPDLVAWELVGGDDDTAPRKACHKIPCPPWIGPNPPTTQEDDSGE